MNTGRFLIYSVMVAALAEGGTARHTRLADAYRNDFEIGAALSDRYLYESDEQRERAIELLGREFNCVTSENLMKPDHLRPAPDKFDFEKSDRFVLLAEQLDLDVVGHVLVWHSQTPGWFFADDDRQPVTREQLIEVMRQHIHTVVRRYKGRVKCWDVVNEAVDVRPIINPEDPIGSDGTTNYVSEAFFRKSEWFNIIGEEYIELAFRFAHEADPDAVLIYNDYGMTDMSKVDFVIENIIRPLKRKKIRLDAVGMQGHWHLNGPDPEAIKAALKKFSGARVQVHITELDIGVLPLAYDYKGADINMQFERKDELDPYRNGIPEEVLEQQAERYREIFNVLRSQRRCVERVTFWGISDKDSWKNNFPVRGRTAYPLLFDRNFKPKPAYKALQ